MTKQQQNEKQAKQNALKSTFHHITKEFGKGTITRMSDKPLEVKRFSSGSLKLDKILGGGYPISRVITLMGPEGAGKSTMALEACASMQRQGGTVLYLDAESALEPAYAKALGVDLNKMYICQPDTGEEALQICEEAARSSAIDLIVVDSVAALVPKAEIEGTMGDQHVGLQARLMSQGLRQLSGTLSRTQTTAIFINQTREKVGVMFGSPETMPGGMALKFYSSVILRISGSKKIKQGTKEIGQIMKLNVKKNKVAPPHQRTQLDLIYGHGISRIGELLDMAVDKDIVDKAGAWYSYGNKRLGQGKANTEKTLANDKHLSAIVDYKVHQAYKIPVPKPLQDAMDKIKEPADKSNKPSQQAKSKSKKQSTFKAKK